MTTPNAITPPRELVQQWRAAASNVPATLSTDPGGRRDYIDYIATRAAQWGADKELEACCKELEYNFMPDSSSLRAARRPKPPSLKQQALAILDDAWRGDFGDDEMATIRRAVEALDG